MICRRNSGNPEGPFAVKGLHGTRLRTWRIAGILF
jgi:hypothetical protein